ncbi:heavy metal-associated isoprenylated plant protein 39-like [Rhododendron vialii]|uniref:heavy metal-associated isoprenylated plant protein 39-like n=1 Tax=Rhododendron vialii TaxID=182163 RepID=UPI0026601403|nr:heavy metal-associated isoprenylated plant protein 39-like [Rhododendron vialii]
MRMRVVVAVAGLSDDKAKRRAMSTAYSLPGVESIVVDVKDQNRLTVTGVSGSLDPVKLTIALRKSCGFAELASVGPAEEPESKKAAADEKKKDSKMMF